jgi:uncharacterized protein YyaL (SSP411 family)
MMPETCGTILAICLALGGSTTVAGRTHPGAEPYSTELQARIAAALQRFDEEYEPRTHFLEEDGTARFTNRLVLEISPYLIQHAHNPVNWFPWGDEAFELAKKLGRPVFLSIGYSTCHWCHVMEKESFEDLEIARYLNENYVAIKVDREERPDVDSVYMTAVQAMTGRGGWPMSTWLTTDRKPFFGGTYFPARDGDRGSRKGFLTLLTEMKNRYDQDPGGVEGQADRLSARVAKLLGTQAPVALETAAVLDSLVRSTGSSFDSTNGGRNGRPKFPSSFPIRMLLRDAVARENAESRRMAVFTLKKMAAGGLFDQVGGGFHRYTIDQSWQVPHFEKMLYDNAQLVVAYVEAFQLTGEQDMADVARRTLQYVQKEMTAPGGGFYSATDADSLSPHGELEEGLFFTWTQPEIRSILEEDAALFESRYGVSAKGNYEGRNILHISLSIEALAAKFEITPEKASRILHDSRAKLYKARAKRQAPLLDDKILAAWNGLMISAFAKSGFVLDDPSFTHSAGKAADYIQSHMRSADGRLYRSARNDQSRQTAFLEDYAFLIQGLLDLYEATGDLSRVQAAIAFQKLQDQLFSEPSSGGYFLTGGNQERLLAPEKPAYDGAEPSGNSVSYLNLVRLHALTLDDSYRVRAESLLKTFSGLLRSSPGRLHRMVMGVDFLVNDPVEIVLVPGKAGKAGLEPFLGHLRDNFIPSKVVLLAEGRQGGPARTTLLTPLEGKVAIKGKATAYVCRNGSCRLPATDLQKFIQQLTLENPGQTTGTN